MNTWVCLLLSVLLVSARCEPGPEPTRTTKLHNKRGLVSLGYPGYLPAYTPAFTYPGYLPTYPGYLPANQGYYGLRYPAYPTYPGFPLYG